MAHDPITAIFDLGSKILDRVIPDPVARAAAQEKLMALPLAQIAAETQLLSGQMEINKIEAASQSLFVAGWRPFVGWTCGFALAYAAIIEPFMTWCARWAADPANFSPPTIDTNLTMQILLGLLGLGIMRSAEKIKGANGTGH